jgi:hypothetical protein
LNEQTKEESKDKGDKPDYEIEANRYKNQVSNALNSIGKFSFGAKLK